MASIFVNHYLILTIVIPFFRCEKEYEKREELISGTESDQARLRGLAMFMGEIYLNVEVT